mmetsp:Transcript_120477/g.213092  ORF Transcript_120477/g.213092 Transcript_120477/m.213092 type:complete len:253 (+) Transcript_120477:59-817(+)
MSPATPRSQGRIVVAPTAPIEVLAVLAPKSKEPSPYSRRASPRESGASAGAFAGSKDVNHRSGSLPGTREAWSSEADAVAQQGPPLARRASSRASGRRSGKQRPKSCAEANQDWATTTLFSGSRVCTNSHAKRSSAVIFRRPRSSRAVPHQRPIFVAGPEGQDAKICVDIHAPQRFCSAERTRYDVSWCSVRGSSDPSRAIPHSRGSSGGSRGLSSYRAGTPVRPESAASGILGTPSVQSSRPASCTPHHWA